MSGTRFIQIIAMRLKLSITRHIFLIILALKLHFIIGKIITITLLISNVIHFQIFIITKLMCTQIIKTI